MRIPWANPRAILDENCRCARAGVQECELPGFAMPPGNARFDRLSFAMPNGNIPRPGQVSTPLGVQVALSFGIQVQFNRAKRSQRRFKFPEGLVDAIDLFALEQKLFFINAASNFESFCMVRDGDILVSPLSRALGHLLDRAGAIAPIRMHLQIATQLGARQDWPKEAPGLSAA
jgi:hypothetical protein